MDNYILLTSYSHKQQAEDYDVFSEFCHRKNQKTYDTLEEADKSLLFRRYSLASKRGVKTRFIVVQVYSQTTHLDFTDIKLIEACSFTVWHPSDKDGYGKAQTIRGNLKKGS